MDSGGFVINQGLNTVIDESDVGTEHKLYINMIKYNINKYKSIYSL